MFTCFLKVSVSETQGGFTFFGIITWILHESEAFICKALKGEAIVNYAKPLIIKALKALPEGLWKPPARPQGEY